MPNPLMGPVLSDVPVRGRRELIRIQRIHHRLEYPYDQALMAVVFISRDPTHRASHHGVTTLANPLAVRLRHFHPVGVKRETISEVHPRRAD